MLKIVKSQKICTESVLEYKMNQDQLQCNAEHPVKRFGL